MSVVGNIKSMSSGVSDLTKKVNELNGAVKTLQSTSSAAFTSVNGVISTGGQKNLGKGTSTPTVMSGSLGSFSTPVAAPASMKGMETSKETIPQEQATGGGQSSGGGGNIIGGAMKMIGGVFSMATAPLQGAYAAAMPTEGIVNRAGSYYQATLRGGIGNSRAGVEAATFKALKGGITGIGTDAQAANVLAGAGFTATPNNKNYLSAVAQVGGAARYLAMDNSAAAAAIAGMQSGQTSANMYQYGITTSNPDGTMKSTGEIAKQIFNTFAPNKNGVSALTGKKITAQDINNSYLKGNLKPILEGLGLSADQQQIQLQALSDLAQGKNPDLASKTTKSGGKGTNENPYDPLYRANASQTNVQMYSERNALRGLAASATLIEQFNSKMKYAIETMALFKGFKEGYMSSNAGRGTKKTFDSLFGGLKNLLEGFGMVVQGGATAAAAAGGGTPGYGGSFGGPRGGGTPSLIGLTGATISAKYGEKGSIWSSTGNTHLGQDYDVPVGTPVYATADGIVSFSNFSPDYGQAVKIDHPNGFSTVYAHLSNKEVTPGTPVYKGTEIGKSGKSGNTTGPSLHYEVQRGLNNPVDPTSFPNGGSPIEPGMPSSPPTPKVLGAAQPKSSNLTIGTGSQGAGATNPNALAMMDFLKSKGFSENGAFGIVANLLGESGLRPTASGDKDANGNATSYGIAQWHLGRKNNLFKFAQNSGLDVNSIDTQSQFLLKELGASGYSDLVKKLQDPNISKFDATASFLRDFERPQDPSDTAVQKRMNRGLSSLSAQGGGTPGYGAYIPTVNTAATSAPASSAIASSGTKNVYITVSFDTANEANATQFAKHVQSILEEKNNMSMIGKA